MTPTQQFDSYFFGDEMLKDACRGVAEAIAQIRAAGLKVEGYAGQRLESEAGEYPSEVPSKPTE